MGLDNFALAPLIPHERTDWLSFFPRTAAREVYSRWRRPVPSWWRPLPTGASEAPPTAEILLPGGAALPPSGVSGKGRCWPQRFPPMAHPSGAAVPPGGGTLQVEPPRFSSEIFPQDHADFLWAPDG